MNPDLYNPQPITDLESLKKKMNELAIKYGSLFRGYQKDCQLAPLLIREKKYEGKENKLLQEFEKYCKVYCNISSPLDFLSVGQHYGLPTRLLDCTHSPYIALFFALGNKEVDSCYVRCFEKEILNDETDEWNEFAKIENETLDFSSPFVFSRFCCSHFPSSPTSDFSFINPRYSNPRMMAQQGAFVIAYTNDPDKKDDWIKFLKSKTEEIVIDVKSIGRAAILEYLSSMNMDGYHLMPDIYGLCDTIKATI